MAAVAKRLPFLLPVPGVEVENFKNGTKNILIVMKCYNNVDIFDEKE
jgi:hypothetical protein